MGETVSMPRLIQRKSIKILIRGEVYEIYSLSIKGVNDLQKCINAWITKVFKEFSALARLNLQPRRQGLISRIIHGKKSPLAPEHALTLVEGFLETLLQDPLELLESVSGLPHALFDPKDAECCLSLDEAVQIGEAVLEVNGLGFVATVLKTRGGRFLEEIAADAMPLANLSAPSPSGMAEPRGNSRTNSPLTN